MTKKSAFEQGFEDGFNSFIKKAQREPEGYREPESYKFEREQLRKGHVPMVTPVVGGATVGTVVGGLPGKVFGSRRFRTVGRIVGAATGGTKGLQQSAAMKEVLKEQKRKIRKLEKKK